LLLSHAVTLLAAKEHDMAADAQLNPSEKKVLDIIWRHGPIARVDIGPMADLSTMSVTRITRELTEQGLLSEAVQRTGGRGQPARPLMIRADAAFAAGVYFSNKAVQVGLIDLSGQLLEHETIVTEAETPGDVAKVANDALVRLMAQRKIGHDRMVGIGFALPGDFITDRKRLNAHALFPGFRGEDMQAELQAACDLKVHVENDAASAALGERLHGIGQTINSFFFAHIGHGIGGGLVLDGRLFRGARGNAGIIGVQFPNDAPRPSGQDLFETLRVGGVEAADFPDLEGLRPQNCAPLRTWINRAASQLRQGLWITARILDPDAIVIGGRLPHHLLQEIVARVDDESFCNEGVMLPRPKVFASSLGPTAGVVGAAAVPLYSRYFSAD
jgi:predicted NBD/HSP70 family sugar kinase